MSAKSGEVQKVVGRRQGIGMVTQMVLAEFAGGFMKTDVRFWQAAVFFALAKRTRDRLRETLSSWNAVEKWNGPVIDRIVAHYSNP